MSLTTSRPSSVAALACIALSLALVVLLGVWSAQYDIAQVRQARFVSEMSRLRSHAERSAGHLERQLIEDGHGTSLEAATHSNWLRWYWAESIPRQPGRLYVAVVNPQGLVVAHHLPGKEGNQLAPDWNGAAIPAAGESVCKTRDPAFTDGREAFDVSVPIVVEDNEIGTYHAGLDVEWLRNLLATESQAKLVWWITVMSGIVGVVLLSTISLFGITRHTTRLENQLELATARRAAEIGQLVAGMAHEIRNPLNAIRLNLYTLERSMQNDVTLPEAEVVNMLEESTREIERLDELIREALGYARTVENKPQRVDLATEVRAALDFLKRNFEASSIQVDESFANDVFAQIDRSRLRQILLNLLNNAIEAVGQGGRIGIEIRRESSQVQFWVTDNGPGISVADRERVFEPFFSTKYDGTGLGLAVVRKLVEEAQGEVRCTVNSTGIGCAFGVSLPACS